MTDGLERQYGVSPLPTAEEVLAGATQGGIAPPPGYVTGEALPDQPEPGRGCDPYDALALATERLADARKALAAAEVAFDDSVAAVKQVQP